MTPVEKTELHPVVQRFVQEAGHMTQSLGFGRVVGQIYAYLFFSPSPCNLADLQKALGISKGSASMCVRQLEQWGAVKKVWVKGDRKDYYEADLWFGNIIKHALMEMVGKRLDGLSSMLSAADAQLSASSGNGELEFARDRIKRLRAFQSKASKAWNSPVVRMLLK
jgi:DNA-binding transcriptional regulator GbsR (MarR family)